MAEQEPYQEVAGVANYQGAAHVAFLQVNASAEAAGTSVLS